MLLIAFIAAVRATKLRPASIQDLLTPPACHDSTLLRWLCSTCGRGTSPLPSRGLDPKGRRFMMLAETQLLGRSLPLHLDRRHHQSGSLLPVPLREDPIHHRCQMGHYRSMSSPPLATPRRRWRKLCAGLDLSSASSHECGPWMRWKRASPMHWCRWWSAPTRTCHQSMSSTFWKRSWVSTPRKWSFTLPRRMLLAQLQPVANCRHSALCKAFGRCPVGAVVSMLDASSPLITSHPTPGRSTLLRPLSVPPMLSSRCPPAPSLEKTSPSSGQWHGQCTPILLCKKLASSFGSLSSHLKNRRRCCSCKHQRLSTPG
jgi:hypothetical protein